MEIGMGHTLELKINRMIKIIKIKALSGTKTFLI